MASTDLTHTAQIIVLSARLKALEESIDSGKGRHAKNQRNERVRELVCQLLEESVSLLTPGVQDSLRSEVERIVGCCDGD
jgi:hypothetical protein